MFLTIPTLQARASQRARCLEYLFQHQRLKDTQVLKDIGLQPGLMLDHEEPLLGLLSVVLGWHPLALCEEEEKKENFQDASAQ